MKMINLKTSIFGFILLAITLISVPCHSTSNLNDLRIKALFLFNFANYVEWPERAFKTPTSPIRMCLYGDIPFGNFLSSVDDTLIGVRRLKVIITKNRRDIIDGCQVLFVSKDREEELPDFFHHLKYVYILSVGDQEGFSDKGGIINIIRTTDQLKFDINLANATERGLFISSELLALAREIKRITSTRPISKKNNTGIVVEKPATQKRAKAVGVQ